MWYHGYVVEAIQNTCPQCGAPLGEYGVCGYCKGSKVVAVEGKLDKNKRPTRGKIKLTLGELISYPVFRLTGLSHAVTMAVIVDGRKSNVERKNKFEKWAKGVLEQKKVDPKP